RPSRGPVAPARLPELRLLFDLHPAAAAMRAAHPADPEAARLHRSHPDRAAAHSGQYARSRRGTPRHPDGTRRQQLRTAIPLGGAAYNRPRPWRFLRFAVRRKSFGVITVDLLTARRSAIRNLPYRVRTHLRRLLLSDLLRDRARQLPQR